MENENLVCKMLKRIIWEPLVEMDQLINKGYSKLFQGNLDVDKSNAELKVHIRGREQKINVERLNKVLSIPNERKLVNLKKDGLKIFGYIATMDFVNLQWKA